MTRQGTKQPTIIWLRRDLRLSDNPALVAAAERGGPVIPVFIWSPEEEEPWAPGGASKWWLHHSLAALSFELQKKKARLVIRRGPSAKELLEIAKESGARAVFWNRLYEPKLRARDDAALRILNEAGIEVQTFNAALLHEPWTIRNKAGGPFQVFTAFWNHCLSLPDPTDPLPEPGRISGGSADLASLSVEDLHLLPRLNWADGFPERWQPGSRSAQARLADFISGAFSDYDRGRDIPSESGTSRLSPHLHFGELSPRQVWAALRSASSRQSIVSGKQQDLFGAAPAKREDSPWRRSRYATELGWREFSHHLIHHFPEMDHQPIRPEFRNFRWRKDAQRLAAWQRGQTGFPIVDAGMREIWATGWMHNRVRMVAASVLVKHLLQPWQDGAKWFWDTLLDADLAQNSMGWQWVAGCGADAAPFFRIFNPVLQGEKFDPAGAYVRRWVPELAALPNTWIHQPWKAPAEVLARAGVELGRTYPEPIVSHQIAREVALETYARIKKS